MGTLLLTGTIMLVVLLFILFIGGGSSSSSSNSLTDIRRSSDATVDKLRDTSQSFREHIDRESR